MDNNQTPRQKFEVVLTYASLITVIVAIFSPILKILGINAVYGVSLSAELLYSLLALPVIGFAFLIYQYRKAVTKIKDKGNVQSPQWLWRLITGKITHIPKPLGKASVMIIVPPELRDDAKFIGETHNQNGIKNISFHFLPPTEKNDSEINEDSAVTLAGKVRSVEDLKSTLESYTSVVLLDDCNWNKFKKDYPRTWEVINDWSNEQTSHPIMALQVEEGRTFKFSWGELGEIKRNNQALLRYLLAQSVSRSENWYHQTRLQRRTFSILIIIVTAILFVSLGYNYYLRNSWEELENSTKSFELAMRKLPHEQAGLMKNLALYRKPNQLAPDQEKLQKLLHSYAFLLKDKITSSPSTVSKATGVDVILFAIKERIPESKNISKRIFDIDEVAATRDALDFDFWYSPEIAFYDSIVSCSVGNRAFIHLTLDEKGREPRGIEGWNLNGEKMNGIFSKEEKTWRYENGNCKYDPIIPFNEEKENAGADDDPRRYLLCAPVGVADGSSTEPVGVICISSFDDLALNQEWARHLIISYGNSLAFFNWKDALPSSDISSKK